MIAIKHYTPLLIPQNGDLMTLRLSNNELIALVEQSYFFNVDNKNLDSTVECFSEDAELTVQTAHVTHRGREQIHRMFHDFMRDTPDIYHGQFSHVVDVDNQFIASQFLARNKLADGGEVSMLNCNFFVVEQGLFKKVTVYMSGENPLI